MKRKRICQLAQNEKILAAFGKYVTKYYYVTNDVQGKAIAFEIMKYMHDNQNFSKFLENIKNPFIGVNHNMESANTDLTIRAY